MQREDAAIRAMQDKGNKNFTFDNIRMNDIGRENEVLLQKLQRIAVKGSNATGAKPSEAKRRESSQVRCVDLTASTE